MYRFAALLFLLGFCVSVALPQSTLNYALNKIVTVEYANNNPEYLSTSNIGKNPQNLTDGRVSASSWFELKPGQTGTKITIDLGDTVSVNRFVVRSYPPGSTTVMIRGYQLHVSTNKSAWTQVADHPGNTLNQVEDLFTLTTARYVRLTVTQMDTAQVSPYSTVIGETEVYGPISKPTIVGVTCSTSVPGVARINCSYALMEAGNYMNVEYRKVDNAGAFKPIASHVPVGSAIAWSVANLPDGVYQVRCTPDTTVAVFGNSTLYVVTNFTNTGLRAVRPGSDTSQVRSMPWTFAETKRDSVMLRWSLSYIPHYSFTYRFVYSIDSGATWTQFGTSVDTSRRSIILPIQNIQGIGKYSFFGVAVMKADSEMLFLRTNYSVILAGSAPGLTTTWVKKFPLTSNGTPSGELALIPNPQNPVQQRMALGPVLMYEANGDSVARWTTLPAKQVNVAVGDLLGDGVRWVCSGSSGQAPILSRDSAGQIVSVTGAYGNQPFIMAIDLDGDGKKEVITATTTGIAMLGSDGKQIRLFSRSASGSTIPAVVDITGDGKREIIFADGLQLKAFDANGVAVAGFPVTFSATLGSFVQAVDLDRSGEPSLIVSTNGSLYALKKDGTVRSGFPVSIQYFGGSPNIAVGDLNNDSYLDIIATTFSEFDAATNMYAIDRNGSSLSGWPIQLPAQVSYKSVVDYGSGSYSENPASWILKYTPYLLSIDGDNSTEAVFVNNAGFLYVYDAVGNAKSGYPLALGFPNGNPVFCDIDGDGALDLIARSQNQVVPYYQSDLFCISFGPGTYNPKRMAWPMYLQNSERTGIAPLPTTGVNDRPTTTVPAVFSLHQNYPNPFNPTTNIDYSVAVSGKTSLRVFNTLGQQVATLFDGEAISGVLHHASFNAAGLASGIYFVRLESGSERQMQKIVLMK